jgi:hypothetical protein
MTGGSPTTLSVHVPLAIKKRGGRREVVSPDGTTEVARPRIDNAVVKALARAFRWKRMPESSDYASLNELARAEKVNPSYLSRVLRLTLLAPDIVQAILDGRQGKGVTLPARVRPFTARWDDQQKL